MLILKKNKICKLCKSKKIKKKQKQTKIELLATALNVTERTAKKYIKEFESYDNKI